MGRRRAAGQCNVASFFLSNRALAGGAVPQPRAGGLSTRLPRRRPLEIVEEAVASPPRREAAGQQVPTSSDAYLIFCFHSEFKITAQIVAPEKLRRAREKDEAYFDGLPAASQRAPAAHDVILTERRSGASAGRKAREAGRQDLRPPREREREARTSTPRTRRLGRALASPLRLSPAGPAPAPPARLGSARSRSDRVRARDRPAESGEQRRASGADLSSCFVFATPLMERSGARRASERAQPGRTHLGSSAAEPSRARRGGGGGPRRSGGGARRAAKEEEG